MQPAKSKFQHRCVGVIFFVALLSVHGFASAKISKLERQQWVEVATDNFRIITDHKEKRAIRLARNLERFRLAYQVLFGTTIAREGIPLKVIAPRKSATFQLLAGEDQRLQQTVGFFLNNTSGNYATVEATRILGSNSTSQQTSISSLFHEYVHYLSANLYTERLPYWYSEGFAEYLSSIQFRDDAEVILGLPLRYHTSAIANSMWMSMEFVLNASPKDFEQQQDTQRLYSQAWLMVHYFSQDDEKAKQLRRFVALLTQGVAVEQALKTSLNRTYGELDSELKAYARRGRYPYSKVRLPAPLMESEMSVSTLSPSQLLYEFGEFFLNGMSREADAKLYFARSLELQPDNGEALAGLAKIAATNDLDHAENQISRALAMSPESQWVNTVAGHISSRRLALLDDESDKTELRNRTIRHYNTAINGGSRNVEAISAAANLYYSERNFERAKELLELAYELAPASAQIRVDLIRVYYALGDFESGDAFVDLQRRGTHGTTSELEQFNKWAASARSEAKRYFDAIKPQKTSDKVQD